jgi:hypothetical protein
VPLLEKVKVLDQLHRAMRIASVGCHSGVNKTIFFIYASCYDHFFKKTERASFKYVIPTNALINSIYNLCF